MGTGTMNMGLIFVLSLCLVCSCSSRTNREQTNVAADEAQIYATSFRAMLQYATSNDFVYVLSIGEDTNKWILIAPPPEAVAQLSDLNLTLLTWHDYLKGLPSDLQKKVPIRGVEPSAFLHSVRHIKPGTTYEELRATIVRRIDRKEVEAKVFLRGGGFTIRIKKEGSRWKQLEDLSGVVWEGTRPE